MATDNLDSLRRGLADRYTIDDEIGRGGMAVVYRARDLQHQRHVAIKIIRADVSATVGPERFLQEIRIAASLQHPNILPLFDSGNADGVLYYVMPLVDGESLSDRLSKKQQLSVEEALSITRDVAGALVHAHERGFVHRDIKPENILLTGGRAVVTDFGIAKAVAVAGGERLTDTGIAVGTPQYMSPEQAGDDEGLDGRSDIYSLGCVLFEMLAGEPPFTGRSAQAIIARHMQERLPSLAVIRPGAPTHVIHSIETALAKVPADRFDTAADFVDALDGKRPATLGGSGYSARRPRWVKVALPLLAAASGFAVWFVGCPEREVLDPAKIVVFPLDERGLVESDSGAGYDIAVMVGVGFEHADPLKTIDGRQRLDAAERSDLSLVTTEVRRAISRNRGAAYYLDGIVRAGEDSATVVLVLHDVAGDSVLKQESSITGYPDGSLVDAGFKAVVQLLPALLDPERPIELRQLIGRDPAAVALWIQGERHYRESAFATALNFYQRAVGEDSLLAFAALKGAQAANWVRDADRADRLLQVALNRDTLLPVHYRSLARGLSYYESGAADSAVGRFRAVLEDYPDWSEAWAALGEVYYHLIPSAHPLDSLAESAFTNAIRYDLAFTPPLLHLAEFALRRGDIAGADSLIERLREADADTTTVRQLDIMRSCVAGGSSGVDWERFAQDNVAGVVLASKSLVVGGAQLPCAEAGFRAVLGTDNAYRWGALWGLNNALVVRGDTTTALTLLDSAYTAGEASVLWLYVLNPLAGAGMESRAGVVEDFAQQRYGEDYKDGSAMIQWLLGTWHARQGEVDKVARISANLRAKARDTDSPNDLFYADAVAAHLALSRGDTLQAVFRLRQLKLVAGRHELEWTLHLSMAVEWSELAELLLVRGEYAAAFRVAALFDHPEPIAYVPHVPNSLAIRLHAAEALGDTRLAERYRERLRGLGRLELAN